MKYKIYKTMSDQHGSLEIFEIETDKPLKNAVIAATLKFLDEDIDPSEEKIENINLNGIRMISKTQSVPMTVTMIKNDTEENPIMCVWGEPMNTPVPKLSIESKYYASSRDTAKIYDKIINN